MNANEGLLTSPEAAKFLAISERKLWDLTDSRKIKVTLIPPRSKRYDPNDLREFIDRCKANEDPEDTEEPEEPVDPTDSKS